MKRLSYYPPKLDSLLGKHIIVGLFSQAMLSSHGSEEPNEFGWPFERRKCRRLNYVIKLRSSYIFERTIINDVGEIMTTAAVSREPGPRTDSMDIPYDCVFKNQINSPAGIEAGNPTRNTHQLRRIKRGRLEREKRPRTGRRRSGGYESLRKNKANSIAVRTGGVKIPLNDEIWYGGCILSKTPHRDQKSQRLTEALRKLLLKCRVPPSILEI